MNIDITQIMVALIGLLGIIVTSVVVPLIKSKMTNEQWNAIKNYALAGVQAAEILIGPATGSRNLRRPSSILKNNVQLMELRLILIPSRLQSRMPGRIWGWIRSSSQKKKLSVKRNRPLYNKFIYIF